MGQSPGQSLGQSLGQSMSQSVSQSMSAGGGRQAFAAAWRQALGGLEARAQHRDGAVTQPVGAQAPPPHSSCRVILPSLRKTPRAELSAALNCRSAASLPAIGT
jgi:hypothetical protein